MQKIFKIRGTVLLLYSPGTSTVRANLFFCHSNVLEIGYHICVAARCTATQIYVFPFQKGEKVQLESTVHGLPGDSHYLTRKDMGFLYRKHA